MDGVQPNSAAMEAGIEVGDVILSVDGTPVHSFMELREKVGASDGAPVQLGVWRKGETFEVTLQPGAWTFPATRAVSRRAG